MRFISTVAMWCEVVPNGSVPSNQCSSQEKMFLLAFWYHGASDITRTSAAMCCQREVPGLKMTLHQLYQVRSSHIWI